MSETTELSHEQQQAMSLTSYLKSKSASLSRVLPRHLTPEKVINLAVAATSRTPKLLECPVPTIFRCIYTAAQLGLEPNGPLGEFYLIPRWNGNTRNQECTYVVGYKGLCKLARQSGEVMNIEAELIYEGEHFVYHRGTSQKIEHPFEMDVDRTDDSKIRGAYACVWIRGSERPEVWVMNRAEIDAVREQHAPRNREGRVVGPWKDDYAAMARKTPLRRLLMSGRVPVSAELAQMVASEDEERVIDVTADTRVVDAGRGLDGLKAQLKEREEPAPSEVAENIKDAKARQGKKQLQAANREAREDEKPEWRDPEAADLFAGQDDE